MANNYTEFSVHVSPLTEPERQWFLEQCKEADEDDPITLPRYLRDDPRIEPDDCDGLPFQYEFLGEGDNLSAVFFSEEAGDSWLLAILLQKYLAKFHPDDCLWLTYACTCSKPRPDEFSGGGHFITAEEIENWDAWAFVEEKNRHFKNAVLPARRLAEKAQALGIVAEQLDELVHEQQAAAAARIDNDGLESQLLYLVEQCGPEAVEQDLHRLADER